MFEGWELALTPGVHSQVLGRRLCIINSQELWTYTLFLKVVTKQTTTTATATAAATAAAAAAATATATATLPPWLSLLSWERELNQSGPDPCGGPGW